jgi:hypothetical protein
MEQVDAIVHLRATGAREGLADAEEFLVLEAMSCQVANQIKPLGGLPYHLIINPCQLFGEFVVKLSRLR